MTFDRFAAIVGAVAWTICAILYVGEYRGHARADMRHIEIGGLSVSGLFVALVAAGCAGKALTDDASNVRDWLFAGFCFFPFLWITGMLDPWGASAIFF